MVSNQDGIYLTIEIWDEDQLSADDFIGQVMIPISQINE